MGVCISRQHDETKYDGWPGVILAGALIDDSIAESNGKEKCCGRTMMPFDTAGHSGVLYYKLYCAACGSIRTDTKKASVQKDPWHLQTVASTLPERPRPRRKSDSSDGTESYTKMPPLSVEDLPRRMTHWPSNQSQKSPIRQLLRPSPPPSQTTISLRG